MWANGENHSGFYCKATADCLEKCQNTIFLVLLSLFLQGIPTLVNRHDRNYEIILKDVKAKVEQVSCDIKNSRFPVEELFIIHVQYMKQV